MADVELVIKITEEMYEIIQDSTKYIDEVARTCEDAVKIGTPLPKGHGRLIDADELRCEREDFDTYFDYSNAFDVIYNAPTIIEADTKREGY